MPEQLNIFDQASKRKLRFQTQKGLVTSDDLWDLPLTSSKNALNLDTLAQEVDARLKASEGKSFVAKSNPENTEDKLRLEVLKRIIEVRVEEREAAKNQREIAARKQALLVALDNKKAESLTKMTEAEIQAELDKM